ncbi:MAG: PQ-loop domain-containing transporter [Acidimicrobiia bacterium]
MNQLLANVAAVAATVGTIAFLIPQITKLIRTGDSSGVSTTWAALGLVANVGWAAYLSSQGFWIAILAPIFTVVAYALTMWALVRTGRDPRQSFLLGAAWSVLLAATALAAGWTALGVVLGLSYGVMLTPSIWTAFRTADPSGISPGTWWIGIAEALLWGYYGWFHTDIGILTFSAVGVVGSVLMLVRYHTTRSQVEFAT